MIFKETKTEKGYRYELEEIFGALTLESTNRISADILDDIVVYLMCQKISTETITGNVDIGDGNTLSYTYTVIPPWKDIGKDKEQILFGNDFDKEICEDTHTSTQEPESESTPTKKSPGNIFGLFQRFVEAFLNAWRRVINYQQSEQKSNTREKLR